MLKKIALAGLFAITFAMGMGAAQANPRHLAKKINTTTAPQGFCFWGTPC